MKKIYFGLFAVLFAFNAQAFDVAGSLNKVSAATNEAAQKVEASKNADANAKAAVQDKIDAKKAELEAKAAEQKAQNDAKKAEQEKAVQDVKDSVNNLKGAFSK